MFGTLLCNERLFCLLMYELNRASSPLNPHPTVPPHPHIHHIPTDDASQGAITTYPHVAWEDRWKPTYNLRLNGELKQLLSSNPSVPVPIMCCLVIRAPFSIILGTRFIPRTPVYSVGYERQMLQSNSPTKAPETRVSAVISALGMYFSQLF